MILISDKYLQKIKWFSNNDKTVSSLLNFSLQHTLLFLSLNPLSEILKMYKECKEVPRGCTFSIVGNLFDKIKTTFFFFL